MTRPPVASASIEALANALARRSRFVAQRPRQAAILLPLLTSGPEPALLLTRRSNSLTSHKGQVAFPGGRAEESDGGPVGTALREAHEEVGLLPQHVGVLGLLDDLPSFDNETAVAPVVARLAPTVELNHLTADAREVARIFAVPLSELCEGRWETTETEWMGKPFTQYSLKTQGEDLWGLSAYATLMMLSLVPESRAPVPRWFRPAGRVPAALGEAADEDHNDEDAMGGIRGFGAGRATASAAEEVYPRTGRPSPRQWSAEDSAGLR